MAPRKEHQQKNNPQRQCIRVAAYCRVSKDTPAQRTSLEQQIRAYEMMIALNFDWELAGIYTDIASGLRLQHAHCNSGMRSYLAARILTQNSFEVPSHF